MFNVIVDNSTGEPISYALVPRDEGIDAVRAGELVWDEKRLSIGDIFESPNGKFWMVELISVDGDLSHLDHMISQLAPAIDDLHERPEFDSADGTTGGSKPAGIWEHRIGHGCDQQGNNDHNAYRNTKGEEPKTLPLHDDTKGGKHGL